MKTGHSGTFTTNAWLYTLWSTADFRLKTSALGGLFDRFNILEAETTTCQINVGIQTWEREMLFPSEEGLFGKI